MAQQVRTIFHNRSNTHLHLAGNPPGSSCPPCDGLQVVLKSVHVRHGFPYSTGCLVFIMSFRRGRSGGTVGPGGICTTGGLGGAT